MNDSSDDIDVFIISDDSEDEQTSCQQHIEVIKKYLSNLSAVYLMSCVEILVQIHKEENLNKLLRLKRQFALHAATTNDFLIARNAYKQLVELLNITDEPVVSITPQLLDDIFNISKSSSTLNIQDINTRCAIRTLLAL